MSDAGAQDMLPVVTLRVPGRWADFESFAAALPEGVEVDDEHLYLPAPEGGRFELRATEADEEFPRVFIESCTTELSDRERQDIEGYTANVLLAGPGGSVEAARRLMNAAAAVIQAGGFGVFCDSSGTAHGAEQWLALVADEERGAYWAFVATTGTDDEIYTTGMHVLGLRDGIMTRSGDDRRDWTVLNNFLGFTFQGDEPVADGDLLGEEETGPEFRVAKEPCETFPVGTPFYNPYGMWRLEAVDPAELEAEDEDGEEDR